MRPAVLMLALLAALLSSCSSVKAYREGLPTSMRDCSICHMVEDDGLPAEGGRRLARPVDMLCVGCHRDRIAPVEHRVGVAPGRKTRLPLPGGLVQCVTCHEPHGLKGYGKLLRIRAQELCGECHDK